MIRKLKEKISNENGFTLIELMLVVVVLGILAGIAVPRMGGVRGQAEDSEVKSNLRAMQSALEMHYVNDGQYPQNVNSSTEYISGDLASVFSRDAYGYATSDDGDGNDNQHYVIYYGADTSPILDNVGEISNDTDADASFYITSEGGKGWD